MKQLQWYRGKKVLVTGGCGFIGSHLTRKLIALDARVTVIDDLSTGSTAAFKNSQPDRFIQATILDEQVCREATKDIQVLFHCAARISVAESMQEPALYHAINGIGTHNLLEAARLNGVQSFIFSSSSSVYGNKTTPCKETDSVAPASPYAYSKYVGELYCAQYAALFNLPTIVLRYFNVYGSGQNGAGTNAGVVARFAYAMARNQPITLFGDGLHKRDFVPVERVVEANLISGMHAPRLKHARFNVATGRSITLLELVEQLKRQFPSYDQPPQFAPDRQGDVRSSAADCTRYNQFVEAMAHEEPVKKRKPRTMAELSL